MNSSARLGLLCAGAGIVLGMVLSWRGLHHGSPGHSMLVAQAMLTTLSPLLLSVIAFALARARPRGRRPVVPAAAPAGASTRLDLVCSATGTIAGLSVSWWVFYPQWMAGHVGTSTVVTEMTLTGLFGFMLVAIAFVLVRDRPRGPTPSA